MKTKNKIQPASQSTNTKMDVNEARWRLSEHIQDLDHLERVAAAFPMAFARLWRPHCTRWNCDSSRARGCGHEMVRVADSRGAFVCVNKDCEMYNQPESRTSQRDTIAELVQTRGLVAYMIGGANRAGKSESAIQLAIALAAGSGEWWVRRWCRLNGIDANCIPKDPASNDRAVLISALTFNDSLEYHRPKLDRWLPAGSQRRKWKAQDQAEVILPNGGRIVLKAAAQGREKFQGNAPRAAILDEEHPEDVYEEISRGLAETDGPAVLSMTPLKGLTWTYQRFVHEPPPGHLHSRITGLDNPHVKSRSLLARFSHLEPHKRDARLYGKFARARGLIYPSLDRAIHVINDLPDLTGWEKYRSIDFGFNFACLWGAYNPNRDQLVIYRELLTQDVKLSGNARQIKLLSGDDRYAWTVADPADRDGRITLARDHDIITSPAKKDVEAGIDAVAERLAVTSGGYARLVIHASCVELLRELNLYRRRPDGTIHKQADHLSDCLRYMIYWMKTAPKWV
jgi:phage terminase large subunit-like protein